MITTLMIIIKQRYLRVYYLIFVLIGLPAIAQETSPTPSAEIEDEVEVIGTTPRSLGSMRLELERVQQLSFDVFNELNDDYLYDIVCRNEPEIGSSFETRVCTPRYVQTIEAEYARDYLEGFDNPAEQAMQTEQYHQIFREKMRILTSEHPELYVAANAFYTLRQEFDEERRETLRRAFHFMP